MAVIPSAEFEIRPCSEGFISVKFKGFQAKWHGRCKVTFSEEMSKLDEEL